MKKDIEKRIKELEDKVDILSSQLNFAVDYMKNDPAGSLNKSRIVLEKILFNVFVTEMGEEPKRTESGFILKNNQFTRKIDARIVSRMNSVRDMGNLGAHGEPLLNETDALRVLSDLCDILEWYIENYASHLSTSVDQPTKKPKNRSNQKKKLLFNFLLLAVSLSIILSSYFYVYKNLNQRTSSEKQVENNGIDSVRKPHQNENKIPSQQWKSFDFKLSRCSTENTKIQCQMVITSIQKDSVLYINRNTTIFDNNGNKALIHSIQYGNQVPKIMEGYINSNIQKELIADVSVQSTLIFTIPDKNTSKISALKLRFSRSSSGRFKDEVIFRDIPL